MKLNYASISGIIRGKLFGFSISSSRVGECCSLKPRNSRPRYAGNFNRIAALCRASSSWSALSDEEKTKWNADAAKWEFPCRLDSLKFLSGRQLFIRRQIFEMTRFGLGCDLYQPSWAEAGAANMQVLRVFTADGRWYISLYNPAGWVGWFSNIYISRSEPVSQYANRKRWIFIGSGEGNDIELDITDTFLSLYGEEPKTGESIFIRVDKANEFDGYCAVNVATNSVHGANRFVPK